MEPPAWHAHQSREASTPAANAAAGPMATAWRAVRAGLANHIDLLAAVFQRGLRAGCEAIRLGPVLLWRPPGGFTKQHQLCVFLQLRGSGPRL